MKTIMVVDSEKNTLDDIKSYLENDEVNVVIANNNRKALELLNKEEDFGLLLINTSMPDSKTPAFFSIKPGENKKVDTTNEKDFLQKPFTKEQLVNFVKNRLK